MLWEECPTAAADGSGWQRMLLWMRMGGVITPHLELSLSPGLSGFCGVCVCVCACVRLRVHGGGLVRWTGDGGEFLIIPQSVFGPLVKWFPSS